MTATCRTAWLGSSGSGISCDVVHGASSFRRHVYLVQRDQYRPMHWTVCINAPVSRRVVCPRTHCTDFRLTQGPEDSASFGSTAGKPTFRTVETARHIGATRIPFVSTQGAIGQQVSFQTEPRPKRNLVRRRLALWHAFCPVQNAGLPAVHAAATIFTYPQGSCRHYR